MKIAPSVYSQRLFVGKRKGYPLGFTGLQEYLLKALQLPEGTMEAVLREGCVGQIPEIYDGESPALSRGCFAQAWSVGEILRVYADMEQA